jgi:hypothetical protein
MSQWEKILTQQIEKQKISPEEKAERIERLEAAIESLRVANT